MTALAPSRVLIDLAAYEANLAHVRHLVGPRVRLCPVVKAEAYGHGMLPIARRALACGASMLAVATLPEGIALREAGIAAPVLLLFEPQPELLEAVVAHELTLLLATSSAARALSRLAERLGTTATVHLGVDTGMNRQGMPLAHAEHEIKTVAALPRLRMTGMATHFPCANAQDGEVTARQIAQFAALVDRLAAEGIRFGMVHAANSAGIVNHPGSHFDMVRPGLMTYGVWPTDTPPAVSPLRPVLRWETTIMQVKEIAPGDAISYGRTFIASERTRIAMLPVGYADGYPVALSNAGDVLIRGQRCPVRGRVCMDQIVVEVTHLAEVAAGDTAVLIGRDGAEQITAEELAARAGTIPYEILTGIGPRVARVYEGGVE
jgi:alanine racemase